MKRLYTILLIIPFISFLHHAIIAQDIQMNEDSTGLLGDHFSLDGALGLFKKSADLADFEKLLNEEESNVNNLDLNEDGEIDYVRVEDHMEDGVHAIVLQVPVSSSEVQDIAVIEIEKTGDESAILQIVGDESLYGPDFIIEPVSEVSSGGKGGPDVNFEIEFALVNVWLWPSVRVIYSPSYTIYASPWRWMFYPDSWRPWRPRPWRTYHASRVHYRVGISIAPSRRIFRARKIYTPVRRSSLTVVSRSSKRVAVNGRPGGIRRTTTAKSTTTVVRKNGKVKAVKKSSKTKVTKGKKGGVKTKTVKKKTKVKKKNGGN